MRRLLIACLGMALTSGLVGVSAGQRAGRGNCPSPRTRRMLRGILQREHERWTLRSLAAPARCRGRRLRRSDQRLRTAIWSAERARDSLAYLYELRSALRERKAAAHEHSECASMARGHESEEARRQARTGSRLGYARGHHFVVAPRPDGFLCRSAVMAASERPNACGLGWLVQ